MSDPTKTTDAAEVNAAPPFGPIHPLVMATRLDAVEDTLSHASVLIERGVLAAARDRLQAAGAVLPELSAASRKRGDKIADVGDIVARALSLLEDDEPAACLKSVRDAQRALANLAREYRQEHDEIEQLPPVRGDEAIMADLQRERTVVPDDCFRDHKHTPTDHLKPMAPIAATRGYESHAQRQAAARKAAVPARRREFLRSIRRFLFRALLVLAVIVVYAVAEPHLTDLIAPIDRAVSGFLTEHVVNL